jgi:hypothetical protein
LVLAATGPELLIPHILGVGEHNRDELFELVVSRHWTGLRGQELAAATTATEDRAEITTEEQQQADHDDNAQATA